MRWEEPGKGRWITTYANGGHIYAVIAGLRLDTSMTDRRRPRLEHRDALLAAASSPAIRPASKPTRQQALIAQRSTRPATMAGLVVCRARRAQRELPARGARSASRTRSRRSLLGDLVRRARPAGDGQRRADRDVGARCSPARRSSPPPPCSPPAAAPAPRSPPASCSTCATCRWGSRSRRRCAAAPLRRAAIGQAMIDFSWAAASRGGGRFDPAFMVGATAPSYPCWVGGTAIGVFAGDLIGDPAALGLDALLPGLLPLPAGRGRAAAGPADGGRRRSAA